MEAKFLCHAKHTVKILKIGTPKIFTITILKMEQFDLTMQQLMHPKGADRMGNSIDPDQTAPKG